MLIFYSIEIEEKRTMHSYALKFYSKEDFPQTFHHGLLLLKITSSGFCYLLLIKFAEAKLFLQLTGYYSESTQMSQRKL